MTYDANDKLEEYVQDLNSLFDWSLCAGEIENEIKQRRFDEYVAWKLPVSAAYAQDRQENRAVRSFYVERLICKMMALSRAAQSIEKSFEIIRCYCIASEPSLWSSEVGIIFSSDKWDRLLFRDIDTPAYTEQTAPTNLTLFEAFGTSAPSGISHMHLSHIIEDRDEEISFRGGFHALWIDIY